MAMLTTGLEDEHIGVDDLNFLALLGVGVFNEVLLAESKTSKKLYAVKSLQKKSIISYNETNHVQIEKRVLLLANKDRHPFLLNMHVCFQTENQLFFLVNYVAGGNLLLHIQRGVRFRLEQAQFYAAEICLALKYLHEHGIIHRNLKLSDILLDLEGHIMISDYRYCKEDMWHNSRTHTFCGTNERLPPEVLLDEPYGRAVDWWGFGIMLYQMLCYSTPFPGDDEDEIYDAILDDQPTMTSNLSPEGKSILQNLLQKKPERRLGSGPMDAQEIMSHRFFKDIIWDDVYHKRVEVPFKPTIRHPQDTSNFDQSLQECDFTPVGLSEGAGMS
ncbi:hypothetical protein LTR84_008957 [Exophiala bonariae]|uniref:non-specific serine/threonine protein kinase n=1 Tax=Exophiala bonariae TaxID=1690606 RepID=A0AAV9MWP5_9EURO|nr:hypothetical protein LTR84_008957 [Exophiala bonariae]